MSEAPRRKGIRFPWLAGDDEAGSEPAAQPQNGQQPLEPADAEQVAPAAVAPAAEPAASETAEPFLQSMVDAMRRIAEQARDDALAKLAAAVQERSTELQSTTELHAADLRDKAEADVAHIGEWEQGEVQRIREEAAAKVVGRERRLDAQLQANTAAGEGTLNAVASRMDVFEQQMGAFFAKLSDLHDPAAFAAAVMQMPSPPALDDVPTAQPVGATATVTARPSWPVEPEIPAAPAEPAKAIEAEPVQAPEPMVAGVAAELAAHVAAEASPVDPNAEPAGGEISTQILVAGLSSFGAITSFKQSLERADGIRRVSLGLGTSGEFVFTATHAAGFEPTTAIRSFESAAQFRTEGGQLKVTVAANG